MWTRTSLIFPLLLCVPLACLTEAPEPDPETTLTASQEVVELCDGSDAVRLSYVSSGGGPLPEGQQLLSSRGFHYLHIKGNCEYWVYEPSSSPHRPVKHGVLTPERAEAIARDLRLGSWSEVTVAEKPPVFDAGGTSFTFDSEGFSCHAGCGDATTAEGDIGARTRQLAGQLYQEGAPLSGDVEILVLDASNRLATASYAMASWPVATPITDHVSTQPSPLTPDVISGADADALRALRARLNDGDFGGAIDFIPVKSEDGTKLYEVYVSDVLPFSP